MMFTTDLRLIESYLDSFSNAIFATSSKETIYAYEEDGMFNICIHRTREVIYRSFKNVELFIHPRFVIYFKELDKKAAEWAKEKFDEVVTEIIDPLEMKEELSKIIDEG